jgi:hypothetical protein
MRKSGLSIPTVTLFPDYMLSFIKLCITILDNLFNPKFGLVSQLMSVKSFI